MRYLVFCLLFMSSAIYSQELSYSIKPVQVQVIKKQQLETAKTLLDINPRFPLSWINRYIEVEVKTMCNGSAISAYGKDEQLTEEQINNLEAADPGSKILVKVHYNPKNTLQDDKDVRLYDFTYTLIPEVEASFPGGEEALNQYLKETAIDKFPTVSFDTLNFALVKFTVSKTGLIESIAMENSSKNEQIDQILMKTIAKMPKWSPAVYENGEHTSQIFELGVGRSAACNPWLQ